MIGDFDIHAVDNMNELLDLFPHLCQLVHPFCCHAAILQ